MSSTTPALAQPLTLNCGVTLKNRFFKAAMHEALAGRDCAPTNTHVELYRAWARGGAAVLVTGNVMVDRTALGEPGNVVVEDERDFQMLRRWARAGTENDTQLWMQINHPGKQSPRSINAHPVAPSAVPIRGQYANMFNIPQELTIEQIHDLVKRFVATARIAQKAGFTGVQIHGAHGYLVNQFLSPLDNQRTDEYGGTLENRMRFLEEIYRGMRTALGPDFPITLKLTSTDGEEGGFTEAESIQVVERLQALGLDLIEISGGSYEKPIVESTEGDVRHGVFFADYARTLKSRVQVPVALTGGFRDVRDMDSAIADEVTDLVGLARPLVLQPSLPNRVLSQEWDGQVVLPRVKTPLAALNRKFGPLLVISWYEMQMQRIGEGKAPKIDGNGLAALINASLQHGLSSLTPRRSSGAKSGALSTTSN